jgi:hypothetical protein
LPNNAFIVVEDGPPVEPGTRFPLTTGTFRVGRSWEDQTPDIAFTNGHVSRKHAEISYREGRFVLLDLSRHGTEVNGKRLTRDVPCVLAHNDRIDLARGAAILRFRIGTDPGDTQDLGDLLPGEIAHTQGASVPDHLSVDVDRREVLLGGKELRPRITGYEFELLAILFRNRGKAVSHEAIVEWVWRSLPSRDTIMRQNVATLVHRLKGCLGDHAKLVVNIPGYGYRLD